ncbi:GspJ2 [Candidatus Magnetoovum chiemensis]|nr:GspJ2 [Candidatus Magnetoovum chiemensis]
MIYDKKAFTLIEIVIAMSILSILTLIIGSTMRLSYRSIEKGESNIETLKRIRSSIKIIDEQIQSFFPLTNDKDPLEENKLLYDAKTESFSFYSNKSAWGRANSIVSVLYEVITDGETRKKSLQLSETDRFNKKQRQTILFNGFQELSFQYYIKSATDTEGQWLNDIEDKENIPLFVKITVVSSLVPQELIFPINVNYTKTGKLNPFSMRN